MSGRPRRSGHISSMEQAQVRAAAGRKGMVSRYAKAEAVVVDPNFLGPFKSLDDYIKRLGPPLSWSDAKKMEEVQGEIINNEGREIEQRLRNAELLTEEQVRERDDNWNRAADASADEVRQLLAGIDGITPDQRQAFLAKCHDWRKAFAEKLSRLALK